MLVQGKLFIARPYSEEMIEEITREFSELLKNTVVFTVVEDESLIGGFRAAISGKLYDASLVSKTRLALERLVSEG